jgi:hypothetical protein
MIPPCHRHNRRNERLPDRPRSLGSVRRPPPDRPGRGSPAGDRLGEADTLAELGIVQRETGDYPAATASLARAFELYGDAGDLHGQANVLNQLGFLHVLTGDYPGAAASQQALALARRANDRLTEAAALINLADPQISVAVCSGPEHASTARCSTGGR